MESADTGKKIYELNYLHDSSLAAKVIQASLRLVFLLIRHPYQSNGIEK